MNITQFEDRINKLQKCAVSAAEDAKKQKAEQWAQIQQKTPDIAKIMTDFNKVFGKPSAIRVEHHGEVILQSGEFQSVRAGVDGTFRVVRGGRYAAS